MWIYSSSELQMISALTISTYSLVSIAEFSVYLT